MFNLPISIKNQLSKIIVHRKGTSNNSFMYTKNIIGHVKSNLFYLIKKDNSTILI